MPRIRASEVGPQEQIECACGCGLVMERYVKSCGTWWDRRYAPRHQIAHIRAIKNQQAAERNTEKQHELIACACGCGEMINRYYFSGIWRERKYIKGHWGYGKADTPRQLATKKNLPNNPKWRENLKAGIDRRRNDSNWQASTTSEASKRRWDNRGRSERIELTCTACGCVFSRTVAYTLRYQRGRAFCSKQCQWRYLSGPNHHLYNTSGREYGPEWTRALRRTIKARDKYMCQVCKSKRQLVVHHVDENKLNNHHDNLLTLCRSCHSRLHASKAMIPKMKV